MAAIALTPPGATVPGLPRLGYVPAIDGLRAIAVVSVLAFHISAAFLPGGYAGVDLFFVISGFVVTAAMAPRRFERRRDMFATFYARRIVRIVPALVVVLLATWLLTLLFVPLLGLRAPVADSGLGAFAGLSNMVLAFGPTGYFAPDADLNPFLHTWTLGVEEQFYLVFPLILLLRSRGGWRPLAAVAAASAASLLLYAALLPGSPTLAFFLMPARFWELGAGMGLFLALPLWLEPMRRLGRGLSGAAGALALLALLAFLIRAPGPHFHIPPLVLPVGAAIALIAFVCAQPSSLLTRALGSRLPVAIGLASYSLYLWHWPVLALMRWTCGVETWREIGAAVLLTCVAGTLSYRWIERPVRNAFRAGRVSPRATLIRGPAALVAAAATTWLLIHAQPNFTLVTPVGSPFRLPLSACGRPFEDVLSGNRGSGGWPACPRGAGSLFVVGDSHALAYDLMTASYASHSGRAIRRYWSPSCEFPPLILPAANRKACQGYYEAVVAEVSRAAGPGDIVFLPSNSMPGGHRPPLSDAERAANRAEALRLLRPLAATGATLLFEAPKPRFFRPFFRCENRFNRGNPACRTEAELPRSELLARRAPVLDEMRSLAAALPRAAVWDPFPILCPGARCVPRRGGAWLVWDDNHLTADANRLLAPDFAAAADAAVR